MKFRRISAAGESRADFLVLLEMSRDGHNLGVRDDVFEVDSVVLLEADIQAPNCLQIQPRLP